MPNPNVAKKRKNMKWYYLTCNTCQMMCINSWNILVLTVHKWVKVFLKLHFRPSTFLPDSLLFKNLTSKEKLMPKRQSLPKSAKLSKTLSLQPSITFYKHY